MKLLLTFSSLALMAALSATLHAADQDHATMTLHGSESGGGETKELQLVDPGCGVTLELDRRQLAASIQIDSLKSDVRFVYDVDYASRDPEIRLSIIVDGIQHFPVSQSDLLIRQAEQAEQGKGNLSTADIDKLYDRAAELEDAPDPAFEEMRFTIGGVSVVEPWTGEPTSPVTDERVELLLGPLLTVPEGDPDKVVPVTFSFAGSCKVIRST